MTEKKISLSKETEGNFEIKKVCEIEATGSLLGSAIKCLGTWAAVALLIPAVAC